MNNRILGFELVELLLFSKKAKLGHGIDIEICKDPCDSVAKKRNVTEQQLNFKDPILYAFFSV